VLENITISLFLDAKGITESPPIPLEGGLGILEALGAAKLMIFKDYGKSYNTSQSIIGMDIRNEKK